MLKSTPTTCSSQMLQGMSCLEHVPYAQNLMLTFLYVEGFESPYTASSVKSLLLAGATITGKTQMDEFGMGSMTTHLPPGAPPVVNPFRPAPDPENRGHSGPRSAGGSSGGSAAAVKSGEAWA